MKPVIDPSLFFLQLTRDGTPGGTEDFFGAALRAGAGALFTSSPPLNLKRLIVAPGFAARMACCAALWAPTAESLLKKYRLPDPVVTTLPFSIEPDTIGEVSMSSPSEKFGEPKIFPLMLPDSFHETRQ